MAPGNEIIHGIPYYCARTSQVQPQGEMETLMVAKGTLMVQ